MFSFCPNMASISSLDLRSSIILVKALENFEWSLVSVCNYLDDASEYGDSHAGERAGHATLGPAVPCRRDLSGISDYVIESCVDACKILSNSLGSHGQSFVFVGSEEVSYRSIV